MNTMGVVLIHLHVSEKYGKSHLFFSFFFNPSLTQYQIMSEKYSKHICIPKYWDLGD
jgi:hypothetical protein